MNGFQKVGSVLLLAGALSGCDSAYRVTEGSGSLRVEKDRPIPLLFGVSAGVQCKVGKTLEAHESERMFGEQYQTANYTKEGVLTCDPKTVASLLDDKGFKFLPQVIDPKLKK